MTKFNAIENLDRIMAKHICKKISRGHYKYRGFKIVCVGYYNPEHRMCWEAIDTDGKSGFGHSYTLRDVKREIDYELDKGGRRNQTKKI